MTPSGHPHDDRPAPEPVSVRWSPDATAATTTELAAYLESVHPDDRADLERSLVAASATPGPFALPHRVGTDATRRVLWVGTSSLVDGIVSLVGFRIDLTREHDEAVERYVTQSVRASEAHRASIERAKGIVMAEHQVDEGAAFTALRRRSNEANVKLRLLAEVIVRERTSRGLVQAVPTTGGDLPGRPANGRA